MGLNVQTFTVFSQIIKINRIKRFLGDRGDTFMFIPVVHLLHCKIWLTKNMPYKLILV